MTKKSKLPAAGNSAGNKKGTRCELVDSTTWSEGGQAVRVLKAFAEHYGPMGQSGRTALYLALVLAEKSMEFGHWSTIDASVRDIEVWTGFSRSTAARALDALEGCGVIEKIENARHGLAPTYEVSIFWTHLKTLVIRVSNFLILGDADALGVNGFLVYWLLGNESITVTEVAEALGMCWETARKNLAALERHGLAVARWQRGSADVGEVLDALNLENSRRERRERIERERADFEHGAEQAQSKISYMLQPAAEDYGAVYDWVEDRWLASTTTRRGVKIVEFALADVCDDTGLEPWQAEFCLDHVHLERKRAGGFCVSNTEKKPEAWEFIRYADVSKVLSVEEYEALVKLRGV